MEPQKKPLGRPRKTDAERMVLRSIRMTPSQWEKIDTAGADALRALVDKWKPKPPNETLRVPRSTSPG